MYPRCFLEGFVQGARAAVLGGRQLTGRGYRLVALKLLSRDPAARPQDALDLHALKSVLDVDETRRAREACELIVRRGFHRGRDLENLLEDFLTSTT